MESWMRNAEEIDDCFLELPSRIAPYYHIFGIEIVLVDTVWQYQPYFLFWWLCSSVDRRNDKSNERIFGETGQSVLLLVLYRKLLTGLET